MITTDLVYSFFQYLLRMLRMGTAITACHRRMRILLTWCSRTALTNCNTHQRTIGQSTYPKSYALGEEVLDIGAFERRQCSGEEDKQSANNLHQNFKPKMLLNTNAVIKTEAIFWHWSVHHNEFVDSSFSRALLSKDLLGQ